MFELDGKWQSRNRDYKAVWKRLKDEKSGDLLRGDGILLEKLVCSNVDEFAGDDLDIDQLMGKIVEKRVPKKGVKHKSGEKPTDYQDRVGTGIGNQVDWTKHSDFRPERRIRRRFPLGGRNLYMTRYELNDGADESKLAKRIKLITASQPPGSLPTGHDKMTDDQLVALTKIGHSEEQTDDIEKNYPLLANYKRIGEATTREQCKDCRHNFPSKNLKRHHFGYKYSAPEDHIPDDDLRDTIIKNKGKKGDLKFAEKQQKMFAKAIESATWARQFDDEQNPALVKAYKKIEAEDADSDDEHSDDEEPLHMSPFLFSVVAKKLEDGKLGTAPVFAVDPKYTFSEQQGADQMEWVEEQRKKEKAATK